MSVVYGLIDRDARELRYVGQTTQPLDVRLAEHRRRRDNLHLTNWLRARPVTTITLERDPEDLNAAEIRWIADMRAQGARLLNLTDGGDRPPNRIGTVHSAESRAKISAALMGRPKSSETRAKMGAAQKGKQHTLGYRHSAETRAKMSAAKIGNQYGRKGAKT